MEYFLIVSAFFVTLLATFFRTKQEVGGITYAGYLFIILSLSIVVISVVNVNNKMDRDKELLRVANRAFINQMVILKVGFMNHNINLQCKKIAAENEQLAISIKKLRELGAPDLVLEEQAKTASLLSGGCLEREYIKLRKPNWSGVSRELDQLLNRYSQTVDPYAQYLTGELISTLRSFSDSEITINDTDEVDRLIKSLAEIFCKGSKYSLCLSFVEQSKT